MLNSTLGLLIVLGIGILLGMLIGNRTFRQKFFVGLRKFLAQISQGARSYSSQPQPRQQQSHRAFPEKQKQQKHRMVICQQCQGTGIIRKKMPKILDSELWKKEYAEKICPSCGGTGEVDS